MLNKELCKKCWKKREEQLQLEKSLSGWSSFNEKCWEIEGTVRCPPFSCIKNGENRTRYITDNPPSKCPFLLEHILNNQGKKENK